MQCLGVEFVELCRKEKNFDVMRTMYSPDIDTVEGDGKETPGQGPVLVKSGLERENFYEKCYDRGGITPSMVAT